MSEASSERGEVVDADGHVLEPADTWQRYIDPEFKDRAPKGLERDFRDLGVEVEGKILPIPRRPENPALKNYRIKTLKEKYSDVAARNFDGVSQVMAMDKEHSKFESNVNVMKRKWKAWQKDFDEIFDKVRDAEGNWPADYQYFSGFRGRSQQWYHDLVKTGGF